MASLLPRALTLAWAPGAESLCKALYGGYLLHVKASLRWHPVWRHHSMLREASHAAPGSRTMYWLTAVQRWDLPQAEKCMVITIPDVGLTEQEVRQELALALFQQDRATLAKAADIAGITRLDFQRLLAARSIPVHYGLTDLADDLQGLHDQYPAAAEVQPTPDRA